MPLKPVYLLLQILYLPIDFGKIQLHHLQHIVSQFNLRKNGGAQIVINIFLKPESLVLLLVVLINPDRINKLVSNRRRLFFHRINIQRIIFLITVNIQTIASVKRNCHIAADSGICVFLGLHQLKFRPITQRRFFKNLSRQLLVQTVQLIKFASVQFGLFTLVFNQAAVFYLPRQHQIMKIVQLVKVNLQRFLIFGLIWQQSAAARLFFIKLA